MNKKSSIVLRIFAVLFALAGIVLLGMNMRNGHSDNLLGYGLALINFGNVFNLIASRQDRKDQIQTPADRVVTVCAIVLAVALVIMVGALLL